MADKSWWEKAKDTAERAVGGVLGAGVGVLEEVGTYVSNVPEAVGELAEDVRTYGARVVSPDSKYAKRRTSFEQFGEFMDMTRAGELPPPQERKVVPVKEKPVFVKKGETVAIEEKPTGEYELEGKGQAGKGLVNVVQGMFGPSGARGTPTGTSLNKAKKQEQQYQSSPLYDATKRDLLNIGEGLVSIAGTAVGLAPQLAYERAEQEQLAKGRKPQPFMTGMMVGKETGEQLAGGMIIPGLVLVEGLRGGEGRRLVQEAPITYALNALPLLKALGRGITLGRITGARATAVADALKRTTDPRTGKPFASVNDLTTYLEDATERAKRGEPPQAGEPQKFQMPPAPGQQPEPPQIDIDQLRYQVEPKTKQGVPVRGGFQGAVERGVAKGSKAGVVGGAVNVAGEVLGAVPYAAMGGSLGGVPGAIVGGVLGSPLLRHYVGKGVGLLLDTTKGTRTAKTAVKRKFAEPRTYETPEERIAGEELLTTEGEVRATEARVADVAQRIASEAETRSQPPLTEVSYEPAQAVETPQATALQQAIKDAENRKVMFEQTADGMSPADADFYRQNVLPNLQRQIDTQIEGFRQQYDAEMRIPRMRADVETQRRAVETARGTAEEQLRRTVQKRGGEVAMGEGAETSVPQAVEELVIDLESPKNKQLFADLQQATKGTALENNRPQQEKLFREMVRSRNNDLVSLIDDNAIERTIDSIEKSMLDKQKFSIDDRDILRKRLKEVGLQARAGVEGEIGNAPPIVSMKLTQAVSDLKKNYFGRVNTDNYTLEQFVKAGTKGSEITPQRVLLRNYLGEMETGLKRKAVQGTTEPFFERGADEDFHRNFLQESFLQNPNEMPNLIGISPAEAIKIIDNEIANPRDYGNGVARVGQGGTFIGEEGYQPYLRKLKEHISNFKADPRTGGFIPSSLAELPQGTEFNLETAVREPNRVAEIVGLLKRGMTTYNPSVLVGNYMGNALVEAMNTGRNPMSILTTQIADTFNFARRVKEQVSGKQPLTLTDELTLRAVPREAITQLVETGGELSWFERNRFMKGIRDAYQAGDTVPKTAEALKVSTDVVSRLQATKPNDVIAMRFTPTENVLVQNNGNGQFAIIDQKSGRLITSGTLESSNVKRVLGQVIKNGVDAKFPDVREIPAWYRQAMNPKNKMLQVGSLIWSMPFMSYVLKAADSPFRRGILGNTLLMDTNPILYETTGGARATLDNAINGFLTPYLRSRGLVNQMSKRIDGLSQQEADELRKLYSFAPNKVKPTIIGTLYNLTDDSSARNIISPSWATYWSMTDTYVRALPGLMNTARGLVSKDPEAKTFTEDKLNIELEKLMMKDQPTIKDTLDASGVAFGLLYPAFQRIEEATQYGKSPLKVDDVAGLLGVVGRVGIDVAEKQGWKEPKTNTIRAEKSKDFKEGLVLTALEMFAGSQFGNTVIPEAKMASLVNGLYSEVWNNVIQKQQDKSDRLRAEGNEDEADKLLDEAEELNDKVIELLQTKVENYLKVLKKVGIKTEMDETSKRFKWKKVKEKPESQFVPQIKEEVETYEPTLEPSPEPTTFPQREEEND